MAVNGAEPGSVDRRLGGAAAGLSPRGLVELIREDWQVHGRSFASPGWHLLTLQRVGAWSLELPAPWNRIIGRVHRAVLKVVRIVYGASVSHLADVGRRVKITNHVGVNVDSRAVIGDDVKIRHNVTIGKGDSRTNPAAPVIGAGVAIGTGAVILGEITVGAGATVGPHAVVVTDVDPGATVFAPPARHMKAAVRREPS